VHFPALELNAPEIEDYDFNKLDHSEVSWAQGHDDSDYPINYIREDIVDQMIGDAINLFLIGKNICQP
jgi:hypothetical protein